MKKILGADFHDEAHIFLIVYVVMFSMFLFKKYKNSVGDNEYEPLFVFISILIALFLYLGSVQLLEAQYFI